MPVVYIDLLFLMNFLMNTVTLCCTSMFLKRPASLIRTAFAAAILAVYSSIMFFPNLGVIYSLAGKILILLLSVRVAFGAKNLGTLAKNALLFFAVNAIFGGVMFALIFATDFGTKVGAAVSNGEIYLNIPASRILLSIIPAYCATFVISFIRRQNIKQNMHLAVMEIIFETKKIKIYAFADTGCKLCDITQRRSAVIISKSCAKKLLPDKIFAAINNGITNDLYKFEQRIFVLPYSTIDKEAGVLYGFEADKLIINDTEIKNCVITVSKSPLCDNGQYNAIFNPDILPHTDININSTVQRPEEDVLTSAERI
ncbi:MAG: sigma-E processing peptidase SpoIIGA [Clostridia bacterium]|nr:sigma-E processing peptidase SpoIIGA [Clostridia bacterium]